jgi:serine/threonine protein phosphatase PrpC
MKLDFNIYSYTNQGGRDYNEDCVRCSERDGVCAVVVADGLGGHGGGQLASEIAADTITRSFWQAPSIEEGYIRDLFGKTNSEVLNAQTPGKAMKSTGVALFIMENTAVWGHAGDSRLYHFKHGNLISQTLDHSVSQTAVFVGEITQEQIRYHEDRNRVLRAFGGDEYIKSEISPPLTLETGDAFLLCTDGFWEYVLESEMELELGKCDNPQDWVTGMIGHLLKRAPKDIDNYSAAAVLVKEGKGE